MLPSIQRTVIDRPSLSEITDELPTVYWEHVGDYIKVHVVKVPLKLRGKGLGTELLDAFLTDMSESWHGVPIFLTALPICLHGPNQEQLTKWYNDFNFHATGQVDSFGGILLRNDNLY